MSYLVKASVAMPILLASCVINFVLDETSPRLVSHYLEEAY